MKIVIKNGRLIDPANGLDRVGDLAIAMSAISSRPLAGSMTRPPRMSKFMRCSPR